MYRYSAIPQSEIKDFCQPPLHKGALGACDICKGERYMKATGIVRRVDDLGRIVIPKEIRRTLKIREGDPSQTTLTGWEVFCFAMLDFCKRGRLENT